jgi:hypothetical protein
VDLAGAYLAPSLIDAHFHVESSMLTAAEFARAVVPHGTGAVVIYGFALIQEGRRGGGCGGGCRRRPARQGSNHVRGLDGVGLRAFTTKENE